MATAPTCFALRRFSNGKWTMPLNELYAQRVSDAIDRGRADIAAGRYVEGIEAAKAAVADKRASRGAA